MKEIRPSDYQAFVTEIKEKIHQAQLKAMQTVNRELLVLYSEIGQLIVLKQEQLGWGKSVIENLSKDLQDEFSGMQGFSSRNLWLIRSFYIEYRDNTKLQPLVAEISWSHNIVLMEKCKDLLEREFYILMTKKYGWSKSVLIHQIESQAYERYLLNQTNFDKALEEKYRHQANLAVKDSYNFDFLDLREEYNERELELGLIKNIRSFLLEMGGDFSFMGNQYKLDVEGDEFFIDLLLYHRRLKCLIAIELKTIEFKPEHSQQLNWYLHLLDKTVKYADDNSSIGILLCKNKDRLTVEYALELTTKPIGVATYHYNQLPSSIAEFLPTEQDFYRMLDGKVDIDV